ncbi:hypothetical protein LINPERPRIM_LOCUS22843 [Linum perenne]
MFSAKLTLRLIIWRI